MREGDVGRRNVARGNEICIRGDFVRRRVDVAGREARGNG